MAGHSGPPRHLRECVRNPERPERHSHCGSCASEHSYQPRATEHTSPRTGRAPETGRLDAGQSPTPGLLSPAAELPPNFQHGQTLTESSRVRWVQRRDHPFPGLSVVDLLHHSGHTRMSARAHACPALYLTQSGSHSGFIWPFLVAAAGVQTCFQTPRAGTYTGDELCADTRAPRGHKLCMDT